MNGVVELLPNQPIFVGFKLDSALRRQIESLTGPDRRYISKEDSTFLRLCQLGDDLYVGKLIDERLTTDRIDDVRRNVLSILRRVCPDVRLPTDLEIVAAGSSSE